MLVVGCTGECRYFVQSSAVLPCGGEAKRMMVTQATLPSICRRTQNSTICSAATSTRWSPLWVCLKDNGWVFECQVWALRRPSHHRAERAVLGSVGCTLVFAFQKGKPRDEIRTGVNAGIAPSRCPIDRKSTRLNSSHANISYAVFC